MSDAPLDSLGFFDATRRVPESTEAAVLAAQDAALPDVRDLDAIVLAGSGPGRWAAEVVAEMAARTARVPVVVAGETGLPAFVGPSTVVVQLDTAGRQPSMRVGGDVIPIGIEVPHARVALGALCAAPLTVLARVAELEGVEAELDHAIAQLHHRRDELFATGRGTAAPTLARRIGRLFPLVYGDGAVGRLAAARWKQQCNVNAKSPAFANAMPALEHDEIAGWGQHGDVTRQVFCAIVLRHDHEDDGADARFVSLGEVLDESTAAVLEVRAAGEGALAQLLDLAYIGDVVSLHLAAQEGLDPGPAPALDLLR